MSGLAQRWERLLGYRAQVQTALEKARREKLIGSSLEAVVEIQADPDGYKFLKTYQSELAALFIVSEVKLVRK